MCHSLTCHNPECLQHPREKGHKMWNLLSIQRGRTLSMFQWKTVQDAGARVRMLDVESYWLDLHVMDIAGKKTGKEGW